MKKIIPLLLCFLGSMTLLAQNAGDIDTSLIAASASNVGFDSYPIAVAVQNDGKIIVGGNFTSFNGVQENNIIRLNINGSKDTSFNIGSGFWVFNESSHVSSLLIQSDGKIIVGGRFRTYNGVLAKSIVRLNANGTLDTSFNAGLGFTNGTSQTDSADVKTIAVQTDGKILVGGNFHRFNGADNAYGLIRLNSSGTLDTTFSTGIGLVNEVYDVKIQADGKIIATGPFQTYNGYGVANQVMYIIRLNSNGTKDTSFTTGSGFNQITTSCLIQPNGKIIIGGWFSSYNGIPSKGIIRINTDGSVDNTFISSFGQINGSYYNVGGLGLQTDGKVVAIGPFTYDINGNVAHFIIRLNTDGTVDTSFQSGAGLNDTANSLFIQNNGKIMLVGNFSSYNNTNASYILRLKGNQVLSDESFSKKTFSIYPNPTKNQINLQFSNQVTPDKIVISDLTGKVILTQTSFSNQVDVSQIANGMYILQTFSGKDKYQSKFIKE